tara:strand:+ start:51 stop:581 length:531 start_codon:yes stop_codon:yes gene_type:complete
MNGLNTILREIKNHDIILGIILVIYIFGGYQTPYEIAPYINNFMGYIIMLVVFCIGIRNSNILVAMLLGVAFVVLVKRSQETDPKNVMPSQNYRDTVMDALNLGNTFNNTNTNNNNTNNNSNNSNNSNTGGSNMQLEEMVVSNMATVAYRDDALIDPTLFKPTMSNNNNAYELNRE